MLCSVRALLLTSRTVSCCNDDSIWTNWWKPSSPSLLPAVQHTWTGWLIEQGLTSHQTHYRSYQGRFLQVIWPNQQCQVWFSKSEPKAQGHSKVKKILCMMWCLCINEYWHKYSPFEWPLLETFLRSEVTGHSKTKYTFCIRVASRMTSLT